MKSLTTAARVAQDTGPGLVKAERPKRLRARYVQACADRAWTLVLHLRGRARSKANRRIYPYKCRSWRHAGDCARWRASYEFRRVKDALERQGNRGLTFLVLTFDQTPTATHRPTRKWKNRWEAFRALWRAWQSFRQAIERTFPGAHVARRKGARAVLSYGTEARSGFVSTVEAHRSGWPHLNVILVNDGLRRALVERPDEARRWLVTHAVRCGFGFALFAEPVRSREEIASYIVKLAGEVGRRRRRGRGGPVEGEVVKLTQVPEDAPRNFRRIRASVRFLDRPISSGLWDGQLDRRPIDEVIGGWERAEGFEPDVYGEGAADPDPGRLTEILDRERGAEPATLQACTASTPGHEHSSRVARPRDPPHLSPLEDPSRPRLAKWYRQRIGGKLNQGPDLRKVGGGRQAPWGPLEDP